MSDSALSTSVNVPPTPVAMLDYFGFLTEAASLDISQLSRVPRHGDTTFHGDD